MKKSKLILILVLMFTASLFFVGSGGAVTIAVDGDTSDWPENSETCIAGAPGCARLLDDTNEAPIPDKWDIKSLYFTNDQNYFYFRYDTFANTDYGTDQVVVICFDVDVNNATGLGISDCEGVSSQTMEGVDYIVLIQSISGVPTPFLFACTSTGCTPTGGVVNLAHANATTEISVLLANLGLPAACTGGCAFRAGMYFDNQQLPPDDNGPNSNSILSYVGFSSIGDTVWFDTDGSKVQDGGESGIPGVTVELYDSSGTRLSTAITGPNGEYEFVNLQPGNFRVVVDPSTLPAMYAQTFDLDQNLDNQTLIFLPAETSRTDVDFGYTTPGSLGDTVWYDANGNGIQDGGEPGLAGVSLTLLGENDGVPSSFPDQILTTTTDANGNYNFGSLLPGDYYVSVDPSTLPSGMSQTYDLDATLDDTTVVTLAQGGTNLNLDFGYTGTGSIGNRVWNDANSDGVQDGSEAGLNGVTVTLSGDFDADGNTDYTANTTTSGDGNYNFGNLPAGDYTVTVAQPANTVPTYDLDGIATANTAGVSLSAGESNGNVDFGYDSSGVLGDRVWLDLNGDGVQDAGEPGLPDVTVNLKDGGGNIIDTTTTDSSGNYSFANLPAGNYTVEVDTSTVPSGSTPSYDLDGVGTPDSADASLADGETREDVDFGYELGGFCPANYSIGDTVWYDADGDGTQNGGELGISGVTVNLKDSGGIVVDTTTTNASGFYVFIGLADGDYTVEIDPSTLPANVTPTYDYDGIGTPDIADVTLNGASNFDLDFGYIEQDTGCNIVGESDCITVELLGIITNPDNSLTYQFEITNGCQNAVSFAAFEVPGGVTAVDPLDGATYNGNIADYDVENTTNHPFHSIKFETIGEGAKNGQTEYYEYTLPAGTSQNDMRIAVKFGHHLDTFTFDLSACDDGGMDVCMAPLSIGFDTDSSGNPMTKGQIVNNEYAGWGVNFASGDSHKLMVFRSSNPSGGDTDLGTPNVDFGGPGIGSGGSLGAVGENAFALGNVLIISEDNDSSDPDDNAGGGEINVTFDTPTDVESLEILDIDETTVATIRAYDAGGNLIIETQSLILGDNSYQVVNVNAQAVSSLQIEFPGSGAVAGIELCSP